MAQFREKVREFLANNTTELIPHPRKIIDIDSKTPVYEGFQVLGVTMLSHLRADIARQQYLVGSSVGCDATRVHWFPWR